MGCSSSLPATDGLTSRKSRGSDGNPILHSEFCHFEPGAKIIVVMDDALVDATVVSCALHMDSVYNISVRGKGTVQRALYPVGSCTQRFASSTAFVQVAKNFCSKVAHEKSTVEDGITGNVLKIEDNLQ